MAFTDDFSGEAGTVDLAAHTPSGGTAWTRTGTSGWATVGTSAELRNNTTDSTGALYLCDDQGSADQYTEYVVRNTNITAFVVHRATNANNYVGVRSSAAKLQIYARSAGALTQVGSTGATTVNVGDVVRFESNGTTHKAFLNGVEEVSGTSSVNSTVTRQGVNARIMGAVAWLDNFEAGALSTGGTTTTSDASPATYTTTASAATARLRSTASPASYVTAVQGSTSKLTSAAPPTAYALSAQGSTSKHTSVAPPASYTLTVLDATGTIGSPNVVQPAAYALTAFDATTVLRSRAAPASYALTVLDATGAIVVPEPPLTDSEKIDLILDILSNRQVLNPATGVFTLYADDGVTVLKTALAWEDAAGTIPYRGQALRRLDAME